jgi:hypothetical protein
MQRLPDYPPEYDEPEGDIEYEEDEAAIFGDGTDNTLVYVGQCRCCGAWHANVTVDCETGSFVDDLATDLGPFSSREEAVKAGMYPAKDWCIEHGVSLESEEA